MTHSNEELRIKKGKRKIKERQKLKLRIKKMERQ
jgi:hypothetical protein